MKQVLAALIGAVSIVCAGSAAAQVADKMPEEVKRCENAGQKFDAEDAIRNCTRILEAPGAARNERFGALLLRGIHLRLSQDFAGALADADKAIPLADGARQKADAILNRAYALSGLKRDAEAVAEVDRAIAADTTFADPLIVRGNVRNGNKQYREALADYDRANALDPNFADARNSACWIRVANLNIEHDKARADCNAAIRLAPGVANFLDSRGLLELRTGDFEAAFTAYDAAVRIDPKNDSALYGRAVAAMALGRSGEADIAAARAIDPKVADDYAARGIVAGALKAPPKPVGIAIGSIDKPTVYDWGDARLAELVNGCTYYRFVDVGSFALAHRQGQTLAQVEASFAKRNKDNAGTQAFCIRDWKRQYPAKAALLEQAALNSPADLDAAYRIGRAEFLAAPVKQMWVGALKGYYAVDLKTGLAKFRAFKTLAQACGTFDFVMPRLDNALITRLNARRKEYGACAEAYREKVWDSLPGSAAYHLESTRTELDSFAPYVCSRYKQAGCIPDARWREFDRIATRENVAFMKRTDALGSAQRQLANEEIERGNQWIEDVNAMVDRYNRNR